MDNTNEFAIVSNCPLCEQHSLHVSGQGELKTQQCINCGYATAEKFKGFKDDTNEAYKSLTEEMKEWSKYANGRVWIPSVITLPFGMLFPLNVDNNVTHKKEMKWAWAEMIDISEEDRKNYPDGNGGFYNKMYDVNNKTFFADFLHGMGYINSVAKELEKKAQPKQVGLQLPKLKKK